MLFFHSAQGNCFIWHIKDKKSQKNEVQFTNLKLNIIVPSSLFINVMTKLKTKKPHTQHRERYSNDQYHQSLVAETIYIY